MVAQGEWERERERERVWWHVIGNGTACLVDFLSISILIIIIHLSKFTV